jgi:hypothetical protein
MNHPPGGDNPVCMYTYTVYTAVCNKSLTDTYHVKLLPLTQPPVHPHGSTGEPKRPESHPTKECARARVHYLTTEPNYYYCPMTLVMS